MRIISLSCLWHAIISLSAFLLTSTAVAQTIVEVNEYQRIAESNLSAGSFLGQDFTLDPATTFEVNEGGRFDAVGNSSTSPQVAFDFGGTTVNVNDGGSFATRTRRSSVLSNLSLNVFDGANVGGLVSGSESIVNIFGGRVARTIANSGSNVTISDGVISRAFNADSGSTVNISGGNFGQNFHTYPGSLVNFFGGEFQLNGAVFSGTTVTLANMASTDIFTGTYENGSPFIFSSQFGDMLSEVNLVQSSLPAINLTPMVINTADGLGTSGLRMGQTLVLEEGGSLRENFAVVNGALLEVKGGHIGHGLKVFEADVNVSGGGIVAGSAFSGSTVNISGGTVYGFNAFSGSTVNISGGDVQSINANDGSTVNISGGSLLRLFADSGGTVNVSNGEFGDVHILNNSTMNISGGIFGLGFGVWNDSIVNITDGQFNGGFSTHTGSTANITGGNIGDNARISTNSTVNIYGGNIGSGFRAFSDSTVNLFVTALSIDGAVVDLTAGAPIEITTRGEALLEATLSDGSQLDFILNGSSHPIEDSFNSGATLTATLVPEPSSSAILCLGGVAAFLTERRRYDYRNSV